MSLSAKEWEDVVSGFLVWNQCRSNDVRWLSPFVEANAYHWGGTRCVPHLACTCCPWSVPGRVPRYPGTQWTEVKNRSWREAQGRGEVGIFCHPQMSIMTSQDFQIWQEEMPEEEEVLIFEDHLPVNQPHPKHVNPSLQDSEQQKFYEDLVDLKVGSSPRIDDPYIKFYPLAQWIFNSLIWTYSYYSWLCDYIGLFLDFFVLKGFSIRSPRFPYVDPFQDIIPAVLLTSGKSAADTSGDAVRQGG